MLELFMGKRESRRRQAGRSGRYRWLRVLCAVLLLAAAVCPVMPQQTYAAAKTPVEQYGRLAVRKGQLVDRNGKAVQLKGVSSHGLSWYPQYMNEQAFRTMRDKWGVQIVRLAMYTAEYNGYCTSDAANQKKLRTQIYDAVDAAEKLGMYVIIDWHVLSEGNPNKHKAEAKKFFAKMAKQYAGQDNVIYEICNEPNGNITWKKHVKPYAKKIIKVIRKYDKKGVIIVGTPTWSQDVDTAAADPIKGRKNIMYALHFYAATHKEWIREKLKTAHKKGLPVIVSEFSICDASGNGSLDKSSGNAWMKLLDEYNISYCAWSLCNKAESASLIASSCSKTGGWDWNDLSPAGKWYFAKTTGR